jgi:membrane protein
MKQPPFPVRLLAELRGILSGQPPQWAGDERRMPRMHRFVHFCVLLVRTFLRNRCPVRASALAYTTLLALVPMLAVAVSVSSLFLTENRVGSFVDSSVGFVVEQIAPQLGLIPQEETAADARAQTSARIQAFIKNLNTGTLGITGTLGLIFVALGLLATIEAAFNEIWGVERGRKWLARVVNYWAAITIGPFLLLAAFLMVSAEFRAVREAVQMFGWFGKLVLTTAPLALLWLAFTLFYQVMPHTRVQWRASLVGGLVGGLLWHFNGQCHILFASRIVATSKIYGGLSIIPVLLIGLYFSWIIVLFGAQVAYAFQNLEAYVQELVAEGVNQRGCEFIAFRLMTAIGVRFQSGTAPESLDRIAVGLNIPTRLAHRVMETLLGARLVVELAGDETTFAPARPLEQISCHDILQAMRASRGQELATRDEPMRKEVFGEFQRILEAERAAAASITMLALVSRAPALAEVADVKVIEERNS